MIRHKRATKKVDGDPPHGKQPIFRKLAVALTVGALLGSGTAVANAVFYTSSVGSFTGAGRTYYSQAAINTNASPDLAHSYVSVNGSAVPAGWLGTIARSFHSDGRICKEGWEFYSNTSTTNFSSAVGLGCGGGYYFSWGVVKGWNGNGYNTVYTYRSPNAFGA